jgi:hypothetical protein
MFFCLPFAKIGGLKKGRDELVTNRVLVFFPRSRHSLLGPPLPPVAAVAIFPTTRGMMAPHVEIAQKAAKITHAADLRSLLPLLSLNAING